MNYVRPEWEAGDEGICCPPTTHFIATIDDLTDILDFDSEDIDVWTTMQEKLQNLWGAGLLSRHTIYTWWIRPRRTTSAIQKIKPRAKAKTAVQTPLKVQQQ